MSERTVELLQEARAREKAQTLFYRRLAAEAEEAGRVDLVERLNELHADEQHHLSRLTARTLELAGSAGDAPRPSLESVGLEGWEDRARERETDEVDFYERTLGRELDPATRSLLEEILASERHHRERLAGKWMSA